MAKAPAPKLADVTAAPEHAMSPILPAEPAPKCEPVPALTLYRGTAIESMNQEQLRATVRQLLAVLRTISGAQSDRQRQRVLEQLKL